MPFAVIVFDFDPLIHLGDYAIRIETLALAAVALLAIAAAAILGGQTPPDPGDTPGADIGLTPAPTADIEPVGETDPEPGPALAPYAYPALAPYTEPDRHLRRDDLLFIVLGIVPGAVLGGRLGYVLLHWDFYSTHTAAISDPAQGSLELSLGLLGGALTGTYVARLLESSAGRWLHVATIPVLLALGLGKLAMAVGGDGQGAPANLAWATAYLGPGPWGSLAPSIPAHPAQIYEAVATGIVLVLVLLILSSGVFRKRDGRAFLLGLGLWAVGRFVAATFWRDPPLLGPLRAGQVLALGIVAISVVLFALRGLWLARAPRVERRAEPHWADPATRPPF